MNNILKSVILFPANVLYKVSPEATLSLLFRLKQGYRMDFENPITYNQKLQWIKIHDRNSLMPICCDKYAVRKYVDEAGCGGLLNDLLWEGFEPEQIPFDALPERYVIKATHGSTFNIIVKDASKLNRVEVVALCKKWLRAKFLPCYGEWFYGIEKPRIVIEKYLESENGQLTDYKVFVFNGKAAFICVDSDRFSGHKRDLYDLGWQLVPDSYMGFPHSDRTFAKPKCLDLMISSAEVLAKPFAHARVDFYEVQGRLIFGEITFTNGAGFGRFSLNIDTVMGSLLQLPQDAS